MQATELTVINIEDAVKAKIAEVRRKLRDIERERQRADDEKNAAEFNAFRTALFQAMPESLVESLGIIIQRDGYSDFICAVFERKGRRWALARNDYHNVWSLTSFDPATGKNGCNSFAIPPANLIAAMIETFANEDANAADRVREAEERADRIAALAATDASLRAYVETQVNVWRAEQPDFKPVTLYEVVWREDYAPAGEGACDYGWSRTDMPDISGFYTFEPDADRPYRREVNPHLLIAVHRRFFGSVEALPGDLKVKQYIEIPDVTEQWSDELDRIILVDAPGETYKAFAGYTPLDWITA